MGSQNNALRLPLTIQEDNLPGGCAAVLRHIKPHWNEEKTKFKVFTDGITNKLVGCFYSDCPDDVVLVRVYGQKTDLLIDRHAETRNIQLLHAAGYAPQLYATFDNGLAYEYVSGDVLTVDTCHHISVFPLVARMMANMHRLDCGPGVPRRPALWSKVRQFMDIMPTKFEDPAKQTRFEELIPPKKKLEEEFENLKLQLTRLNSPIVFCHNDLLLGNVIYNAEKNSVTFIDYEYSSYNYQAFDIGNHFAEFAGVSDVDFGRYPSEDFQRQWISVYLEAYEDREPTNDEVEQLLIHVNKFALAAHFLWAVWSLIQAEHSSIDFDFLGYSSIKLKEYFGKKEKFLNMEFPNS
ncbi:ethanolamine kinase 1 isoform X2 [Schistocerca gregaria]|uniref:ethanolamine kinase 1 isoform X2 n=1 Tax=Schistocerca gregaria TaxID=7010 RepID=UPI00211F2831|nr:ethanolamine kinase 1 isoform X2 [Schistocerca gregaria]